MTTQDTEPNLGPPCPWCQRREDHFFPLAEHGAPLHDMAVCMQAGQPVVRGEDDVIRKPTEAERSELEGNSLFRGVVKLHAQLMNFQDQSEGTLMIATLSDGRLAIAGQGTEFPEQLREVVADVVHEVAMANMAKELSTRVTPEIANHVLSSYGNEQASMPSLATGALINLIRTAFVSDDAMMAELADVDEFRGYVLAVTLLAEVGNDEVPMKTKGAKVPLTGLEMLEIIAGLRAPSEQETGKR